MLFNSLSFLIFFPVVVGIYFIIPRKVRWVWLLIASYYYYMSWNRSESFMSMALNRMLRHSEPLHPQPKIR